MPTHRASCSRVSPRPVWIGIAVLFLSPMPAAAQQAAFAQAFFDLTTAIEGTYGDEGARIRPALDRMSAALFEWDREIEVATRDVRASTSEGSSERRISLARMLASRGRLTEALSELDVVSRLQPRRTDVHVLRGLVLQASGKSADSIEAFRTAWSIDPSDPIIASRLFHGAMIGGNAKAAREAAETLAAALPALLKRSPEKKNAPFERFALLRAALDGPPLVPLAAYAPAFRLIARREYEKAIEEFRRAAARDPLIVDPAAGSTSMLRAVEALRKGRFEDARAQIGQAAALPGSSEAARVLGLIYWADSDYEKSIAALKDAIRRSPGNERARLALSRVLSSGGREAEAAVALEETLRVLPESALARWWLASAHERVNRFADARVEYERAAAAAIVGQHQLLGAVGRLAAGAADVPGAIDAFARAVSAEPNDAGMHRSLAGALVQQDREDEALAAFIAAILIDPRDAPAYGGIGQVHLNAGRVADAVNVLQRATEIAPANNEARYALATALARLGRTDEAAKHFARVEQEQRQMVVDSRRTLSHDTLKEEAALRVAEGRFETAITLYEKALGVRPDADVYRRLADLYTRVGRASDAARARAMYEKARRTDQSGSAR